MTTKKFFKYYNMLVKAIGNGKINKDNKKIYKIYVTLFNRSNTPEEKKGDKHIIKIIESIIITETLKEKGYIVDTKKGFVKDRQQVTI